MPFRRTVGAALLIITGCAPHLPVVSHQSRALIVVAPPIVEQPQVVLEEEVEVAEPAIEVDTSSAAIDDSAEDTGEEESRLAPSSTVSGHRYTADIDDRTLADLWKSSPEKLGSISIGFADEGRIINAEQFPADGGDSWMVVTPEKSWATAETIDYVLAAVQDVKRQFPHAPPLRINNMSSKEGGWLRPHKSHQAGRDVDLAFYYPTAEPVRCANREDVLDRELTWALVKALITHGDVQVILVDRRVQKVLHAHALSIGEDPLWLDSLFGPGGLIQHARRHRDHLHIRYFNPRAQELGRRVAPLLAQRPDQNIVTHRVKSGDTLGALALKYGTTVSAIQKANRTRGTFLRLAQVLKIPLRGPCTQCPVPPAIEVPPRRLAPPLLQPIAPARTSTEATTISAR